MVDSGATWHYECYEDVNGGQGFDIDSRFYQTHGRLDINDTSYILVLGLNLDTLFLRE